MFSVHGKYTNAIYKNHSFSWLIQFSIYTHQHPLKTYNKNSEYFVTTCEHNIVIIPLFRVKLLSLVPFEIITISINLFIIIRKHNEYYPIKMWWPKLEQVFYTVSIRPQRGKMHHHDHPPPHIYIVTIY